MELRAQPHDLARHFMQAPQQPLLVAAHEAASGFDDQFQMLNPGLQQSDLHGLTLQYLVLGRLLLRALLLRISLLEILAADSAGRNAAGSTRGRGRGRRRVRGGCCGGR